MQMRTPREFILLGLRGMGRRDWNPGRPDSLIRCSSECGRGGGRRRERRRETERKGRVALTRPGCKDLRGSHLKLPFGGNSGVVHVTKIRHLKVRISAGFSIFTPVAGVSFQNIVTGPQRGSAPSGSRFPGPPAPRPPRTQDRWPFPSPSPSLSPAGSHRARPSGGSVSRSVVSARPSGWRRVSAVRSLDDRRTRRRVGGRAGPGPFLP